ncbi:hypothetical protein HXX01_00190 [Candidatus Nomurabacteria bacterium]|nr:hypothetical protein [Candidatus Nomurabacteria bacterium]
MNREYLPSKIFMIKVAFIFVIIATIFGVYKTISYFKNRPSAKAGDVVLVKDVVGKDSNNNGIADWEEYLWGLDPLKNGASNKEYIMAKKKTLSENNPLSAPITGNAAESEALSQEFFAVVVSLMQSGGLTEDSIAKISDTIGQKIVPEQLPDIYTRDMLVIDNKEDGDIEYFQALDKLNKKYADKDMGGELTIIAQGLANNNPQALRIAASIAESYRSFGQELVKLPVPEKIALGHLSLANDYEKIAKSLEGFSEILDNPLVGMKALLNYKKYNDSIASDLASISSNLE